jgi:hypothetical protein
MRRVKAAGSIDYHHFQTAKSVNAILANGGLVQAGYFYFFFFVVTCIDIAVGEDEDGNFCFLFVEFIAEKFTQN